MSGLSDFFLHPPVPRDELHTKKMVNCCRKHTNHNKQNFSCTGDGNGQTEIVVVRIKEKLCVF